MRVLNRAEPGPAHTFAAAFGHVVLERSGDICDGHIRACVRVREKRVQGVDPAADEQERRLRDAERGEHVVVRHAYDRDVRPGGCPELGQDRGEVLRQRGALRCTTGRFEKAAEDVELSVEA